MIQVTVLRVLVALLTLTSAWAVAGPLRLSVQSPGLARLVTVPVEIQGREYRFMLDTGTSHHVLDSSLRPLLGQSLGQTQLRSGEVVEAYAAIPMTLGNINVPTDWPVNTMNLEPVRRISGHPVYGILGMRLLKHHVLELDFHRETVRLFDRLPYDLPGWQRLPIRFNGRHQPLVQARAGDLVLPILVDTGFNGQVALAPRAFNQLRHHGNIQVNSQSVAMTVVGMVNNPAGQLSNFELAGLRYPQVGVHQAHLDLLGLGVLSRQAVVMDFPGQQLWLAPPPPR